MHVMSIHQIIITADQTIIQVGFVYIIHYTYSDPNHFLTKIRVF